MKSLHHLLRLEPASSPRHNESVHIVTREETSTHGAVFRAPALPTPHQLCSELPFTTSFGPRLKPRP